VSQAVPELRSVRLAELAPEPGEFDPLKAQVPLMRDFQRWAEFARDA